MRVDIKKLRIIVAIIVCSISAGCSSIETHVISARSGFGLPFSGTAQSIVNQPCALYLSASSLFITYPFSLIDVPLSFAADLVFLPADLILALPPKKSYGDVVIYSSRPNNGCVWYKGQTY